MDIRVKFCYILFLTFRPHMERMYVVSVKEDQLFESSYFENFDQIKSFFNGNIEICLENTRKFSKDRLYFTYYNLSKTNGKSGFKGKWDLLDF